MQASNQTLSFLPHINGIRALAILGVLLYHLNADYCPTGYLGVDVFLVISGYLLFRSLLDSGKVERFHYGHYLLGKAWRLLPSWFICTFIVTLVCAIFMSPLDSRFVVNTAVASSLFLSSFYVDICYNYFNPTAHLNALLHLWYLCVVVHLYVVAPFLVVPLVRKGKKRWALGIVALLSLLSLVLYVLTTGNFIDDHSKNELLASFGARSAYYHLVTRFWEFGAGCLICLMPELSSCARTRNLLALTGFTGIVLSFFLFETRSSYNYLTVVSTVLLLSYGGAGWCSRFLSLKPVQFLGTISFSLYLWHWPLMVIWRYCRFSPIGISEEIAMIGASLLFGCIAWRGVERKVFHVGSMTLWARCCVVALLPMMLCVGLVARHYIPGDEAAEWKSIVDRTGQAGGVDDAILHHFDMRVYEQKPMYCGDNAEAAPIFLLMGDSHTNHLHSGVHLACSRMGIRGVSLNNHVLPMKGRYANGWSVGKEVALIRYLEQHSEIRYVLISMWWSGRFFSSHLKDERKEVYAQCLQQTCSLLKSAGVKVILIADNPSFEEQGRDPWREWARRRHFGVDCSDEPIISYDEHLKEQTYSRCVMEGLLREGYVHAVIDAAVPLFEDGYCSSRRDGQFLFRDSNHFTPKGSEIVGGYVVRELKEIISKDTEDRR